MIGLGDLSTVEGWVRWLWGRDDPFGRAGAARAAVAGMPRAHFQLVAGGHIPWLGDPGNVGALIAADAPPIRSLRTTLVER
jgi:pimeloyl-ACP methyl ester carboxylesterase